MEVLILTLISMLMLMWKLIWVFEEIFRNYFKGSFQKRFNGFCPLRGYPPLTPLTENHFAKKPLVERGGTPPPLMDKIR